MKIRDLLLWNCEHNVILAVLSWESESGNGFREINYSR
ncbi:hypothetical protein ACP8EL_09910 [Vibrio cholerae]